MALWQVRLREVDLPDVGTDLHTLKMTFTGDQIEVYYDGVLEIN